MCKYLLRLTFFLLLGFVVWMHMPFMEINYSNEAFMSACFGQSKPGEPKNNQEPDVQWFREKMKISPKYMERKEGVLGMSWTHFFTMLFLILFFLAAMTALVMRQRRTKQLLNTLLKEESHGPER